MSGKRIQDLNLYGSVDTTKAKKDLIEISKNEGTYGSPVYGVVEESVYQTKEQLASDLGIGKRIFESMPIVDILFTGVTSNPYGFYAPFNITIADDCKRFVFNVSLLNRVHYDNNKAVLLNLPTTPREGFCFAAHFNTFGGNKISASDKYLASGSTHLISYKASTNQWYIDEWLSVDSPFVTYLTNYNSAGLLYLTNTNHNYVLDSGYEGNSNNTDFRQYWLIDSDLCKDRYVDISLATDLSVNTTQLVIYAEQTGFSNTIIGHGNTWAFPLRAKAGSHVRFKALANHKWIIDKQNIII